MQLAENMVVADRYRLVRMIGRGGMGSVWQAMHMGLDTPCAVKFIEGELANLAEAHQRFEREAKAAAQLRSPHVVGILDHGVWQSMPYIAMELLEGEDLGKRIAARGGRLAPSEIAPVVQQVCRALSKAHAAGIVHRDLKPDNIFIVKDDDREIVKILDFGVAKSAANAIEGSNTRTGAMLGTPYYMSPEQAQGIKSVDARSDLWSLAVIVFQCLTGRLPFESEALGDLLVKIIVSPVPWPSQYWPNVPPGLDNWWSKAADRNPDNRFQTAKAFADSLTLALGQSSITDVTERSKIGKSIPAPNQTHVMNHQPNTPFPAQQSGPNPAFTAHMNTPGQIPPPQSPMYPGAQHQQQPGPPPQMGTPMPSATFGGVEPAPALPIKKGPPVAVFVVVGVLAVVGLGLGGATLMKKKPVVSADPPPATSSVHAENTTTPDPVKSAEPATTTTKPADPPATSVAEKPADPAPVHPVQNGNPGNGGHAKPPVSVAQKPGDKPVPPVQPPPPTNPTTKPTGEKPINLGF